MDLNCLINKYNSYIANNYFNRAKKIYRENISQKNPKSLGIIYFLYFFFINK
jgi:hypothetical protein